MGKILLCADTESLIRPMLLGLEEASLDGKEWLVALSSAKESRDYICSHKDVDEAWVVSSDDLVGVNIAAALRADNESLPIYLVVFDATGSDLSRAKQANVTGVFSVSEFCKKFELESRRRSLMEEAASLDIEEMMEEADGEKAKPDVVRLEIKEQDSFEITVPKKDIQADPSPKKLGYVISVLSGSGGVGKSAVTAICAHLCAQKGFKTAVVDCDLQFGDMHQMSGSKNAVTVDDILADSDCIENLSAATSAGKPAVIGAPSRLERSEELSKHLIELIDVCASAFEIVFVNTGSNWTECHAQLLERSNCSILLLDQRASSIRSCQHALDLCMRLGIASGSFVYALNRCERGSLFSALDIANVMQGAHVFELKEGGAEVEELLGAGLAEELAESKNELCQSISAMLEELLPSSSRFSDAVSDAQDSALAQVFPERSVRRKRARRHEKKSSRAASPKISIAKGPASNEITGIESMVFR